MSGRDNFTHYGGFCPHVLDRVLSSENPVTYLVRMMSLALGVVLFACLAAPSLADDSFPTDLAKWVVTEPPRVESERWREANWSVESWDVFLRDGHPSVRAWNSEQDDRAKLPFAIKPGQAADGLAGRIYAVKVADGWIVGFNAGEFGAGLWWFAPDGKSRYQISHDYVCGFVQTSKGLLALEGLAHMGSDRGELIGVNRGAQGQWQIDPFVDLGNAPEASTRDKDWSLIVVTTERLLRVRLDKQVDVLVDHASWGGLYSKLRHHGWDGHNLHRNARGRRENHTSRTEAHG
jgi:hypothetical protein